MTCLDIMPSDTAHPETNPHARPETFRSHLPAIVAATTGTVLAAILGSLIGAAGTIAGIVIGSLASGTASWWAERGIRRSAALAAARAEAIRARGYPLHPGEHAAATRAPAITRDTAAAGSGHHRSRPRLPWRWAGPAAFILAAFVGAPSWSPWWRVLRASRCPLWSRASRVTAPPSAAGQSARLPRPARHRRHRPARQGPPPPARRRAVPAAPRRPALRPPPPPVAPARSAAHRIPQPPLPRRLAQAASGHRPVLDLPACRRPTAAAATPTSLPSEAGQL